MANFLEKIQAADSQTKRRVLFISSCFVMVVVVYAWLAYFNSLVTGYAIPAPALDDTSVAAAPPPQSSSFLNTMERGSAVIGEQFMRVFRIGFRILQGPREYTIKP